MDEWNNKLSYNEIRDLLCEKAELYERHSFIADDPISIPHQFTRKEDIEISGLLAALISWGNRKAIVKKANELITFLDGEPYEFVMQSSAKDEERLSRFVYRTFQSDDLCGMVRSLQHIYLTGGLEEVFRLQGGENTYDAICRLRQIVLPFLSPRTHKHIADPSRGSAAKRINMFLRWMVRPAARGVDFGLWKSLQPKDLILPLDVHTGNTSRLLGLTERKQNDRRTAEEITAFLRKIAPEDPIRFDFALFGLGMFDHLK